MTSFVWSFVSPLGTKYGVGPQREEAHLGVASARSLEHLCCAMIDASIRFFFDAVDPLSFAMHCALGAAEEQRDVRAVPIPIESYPADAPLTDTQDPFWQTRWAEGQQVAEGMGLSLVRPGLVPRSGKAHELLLHAQASELGRPALHAIFSAFFLEGRDIGRIDVLVDIAQSVGLGLTESKAVLDVDRYGAEILSARQQMIEAGMTSVPALLTPSATLQGFHNQSAIGTFLDGR